MTKTLLLFGLALPLLAQQTFDFHTLDKLDALTDHKTKIALDGDMLQLAGRFIGSDDDKDAASIKSLVSNLKGIYLRTYEFDRDGQYTQADLEPFRVYLKQQQWSKIVESQEGTELDEIYIQPLPGDRFGGVAIISAEPRELTIVYISGTMNLADLEKLEGNMGVPAIDLKNARKLSTPAARDKKED